jgi:lipopolysaccharide transport system ATP-binding protein
MSERAIEFRNVSKSYPLYTRFTKGIKNFLFHLPRNMRRNGNSLTALKDVSFQVKRGEAFGIIGANGAGKSTALALIAGVVKPSSGSVRVKGRISPMLELGAGFHPELTGRENIIMNGVLMGLTRKEVLRKMDEIIDFSELGRFIDQPIRVYSSGMLARLGFSVVAHLDPEILLIDEVLAVGDAEFQKKCMEKIAGFRKGGITIVLVSHSMETVRFICDRAVWMDRSSLRMSGPPSEVILEYMKRSGII